MKTKGLNAHRLKDNPEERRFAKAWAAIGNTLAYLIDPRETHGGRPPTPADRDEVIAATVVQWLGSPVGHEFLTGLGYEKLSPGEVSAIVGMRARRLLWGKKQP